MCFHWNGSNARHWFIMYVFAQLPRWKQDEIMVEHLTRKCAALEAEMKEEADRFRVSGQFHFGSSPIRLFVL